MSGAMRMILTRAKAGDERFVGDGVSSVFFGSGLSGASL
jgi:hypothetical protein